jgi:hypothetical protein
MSFLPTLESEVCYVLSHTQPVIFNYEECILLNKAC